MPINSYEIIPYGDSAFLVQFPTEGYSEKVTLHIHALIRALRPLSYWEELVPGYNSLLAYFCPAQFAPQKARAALSKALKDTATSTKPEGNLVEIPICYGGEFGPDMDVIKSSSGLGEKEIVQEHSSSVYTVCMMGFIPGFTFLSEAPKVLHHNRRDTPRQIVPAGSVGIAGWQTGIYGLESPGGWQIIGRTPLAIFDARRDRPFLLRAGDRVQFKSISPKKFAELSE